MSKFGMINNDTLSEPSHEGTICIHNNKLMLYIKGEWVEYETDQLITITKEQVQSILFLIDISESCIEATEFGGDYGNLSEEYDKLEYDLEKKIK